MPKKPPSPSPRYISPRPPSPKTPPPRLRNWVGIIYTIVSALIIIGGTYLAIRWAQGDFRLDQNADLVAKETGLLHATSTPKGAEVYVDGKLTSVTDDIVYLSPGEYKVEIRKDGYSTWEKTIRIEKALVSQTNATLFPYSPNLTSLTYTGVTNVLRSPDNSKILFYLDTASAKNKNGLYVLNLNSGDKNPHQISDDDATFTLAEAKFLWSPDSNEILVVTDKRIFLLNANSFVNLQSTPDVQLQLKTILTSWEENLALREQQFTEKKIHPDLLQVILANSHNAFLSPDNTKIIYTATNSAALPTGLMPALPAPNSQPETRALEPNQTYIYDSYEDKNYLMTLISPSPPAPTPSATPTHQTSANQEDTEATTTAKLLLTQPWTLSANLPLNPKPLTLTHSLQEEDLDQTIINFTNYYGNHLTQPWLWTADSTHLVGITNNQIVIVSYDGSNPTVIYSWPFVDDFVLPHPNGNSVLILTNFNPDSPPNFYAIELKN